MPSRLPVEPYVGPQPFRRADAKRFFGREEATDELLSLVLASRVVVFYAQSGAGKSSLVNAGLRPLLEKNGFDILPTARVQGGLPAGKTAAQLGNPYVYFTLVSWGAQTSEAVTEGTMSTALAHLARSTGRYGDPAYRLLIFDQFEELFTSFPACWAQRGQFVTELVHCVANDERLRVLFIVREDHLADALSLVEAFPAYLRSSMRLPLLGKDEAVEAIEGPLRGSGFSYAPGVAAQLVEDLSQVRVEISPGKVTEVPGDSVEPVQLQVVCTELWHALPSGTTTISSEYVNSYGDTTDALAHYYDNAVRGTARQVRIDSVFVRRWISAELITSANTRGTAHRGVLLTAGLPNPVVDGLENRHLIRAETRAGARWYELTHDRFLHPIEKANTSAIRRSRLGYWGALVVMLMISLLFLNLWPYGKLDVVLQIVLAVLVAAGFVQVSWMLLRRQPKYWQPFEPRPRRARIAALGRKMLVFLFIAVIWLFLFYGAGALLFSNQCGIHQITILLRAGSGSTSACLQQSSRSVDWGLLISSALLATLITWLGSRLSRRRAVRKWQRMADRQTEADVADGETIHSTTPDLSTPEDLAEADEELPDGGPARSAPR